MTIVLSADMNNSLALSLLLPPASSASSSALWSLFTHSYLVIMEFFGNFNECLTGTENIFVACLNTTILFNLVVEICLR